MTVMAVESVQISMGLPCDHASCEAHATPLYEQLSVQRYSRSASVMGCPESVAEWRSEHRTARRRALRASRMDYSFAEVDYSLFSDDIFAVNTSRDQRQGRPMSDGYTVRRQHGRLSADQTRCPRHRTYTYGVLHRGHLRAYTTIHRSGDLAMVSMVLGHGDYLDDGIMFLLFQGVVEAQAGLGGFFFYNVHSSGKDGLRWMKERLGFRPADIVWSLS